MGLPLILRHAVFTCGLSLTSMYTMSATKEFTESICWALRLKIRTLYYSRVSYDLMTRVAGFRCDSTTGRRVTIQVLQDLVSLLLKPSFEQMEILCRWGI